MFVAVAIAERSPAQNAAAIRSDIVGLGKASRSLAPALTMAAAIPIMAMRPGPLWRDLSRDVGPHRMFRCSRPGVKPSPKHGTSGDPRSLEETSICIPACSA